MAVNALRLRRVVEVYQWQEEKHTTKNKKAGGGEETTTTYTYKRVWSNKQPASHLHQQENHQDPIHKPFEDQTWQAQTVTVGAFTLSPSLANKITDEERLPAAMPVGSKLPDKIHVQDGLFYLGQNPNVPAIGDARIEFKVVLPATVSIVAKQSGHSLEPFHTQGGDELELLMVGTHSAPEMFQNAQAKNTSLTWTVRVTGFGLRVAGLVMVFRPLVVLADVIPFVGGMLGVSGWFFALVVAFALSFLVISVSWLLYRPRIGLALVAVGLAGLTLAFLLGRRRQPRTA